MPKRSSKDVNVIAASIVGQATAPPKTEKNPHAVALGRLGGLKGGRMRVINLTPERRREIAQKGARARWGK